MTETLICKDCGKPLTGLDDEGIDYKPGNGVGLIYGKDPTDPLGPSGPFHLDCVDFCEICGEVETMGYLEAHAGVCRRPHPEEETK